MVVPGYSFYKFSPQYQSAYEEGFNNARWEILADLSKLMKKVADMKAFVETSGTAGER